MAVQKLSLQNLSHFVTPAATHANVRRYTWLRCPAVNSKRATGMPERGGARSRGIR
jgi:hypothetical protein